jgi:hypothetical protein
MTHLGPAADVASFPSDQIHQPLDGSRLLARGLVISGLTAIAVVHLAELPDTWRETPGLGALFGLVVIASVLNAVALVHSDHRRMWQAAGLVALSPIGGYLLTRSVAVPFDRDDVGNWLEPSVLVAVFVELSVVALCGHTLLRTPADSALIKV